MNPQLRENKTHGSPDYPYSQYSIRTGVESFQFPVHWHRELELIYVRSGCLQVKVGDTDYAVSGGEVLIVNPQQLHLMGSEGGGVHYHTILFPLEFLSFQTMDTLEEELMLPLRTGNRLLPARVPRSVLTAENRGLLDQVLETNRRKDAFYQLETRVLLLRFLLEVIRCQPPVCSDASAGDAMQKELLEYIRLNYRGKLTLDELGARFHLSPKYLSRYFKEHFHLPFSQYLSHLRLTQAKLLLETTQLPVTEIALSCGYGSVSFFIREFRKANGTAPLRYRRGKREEAALRGKTSVSREKTPEKSAD